MIADCVDESGRFPLLESDLTPLPHESIYSLLARMGQANVLSGRETLSMLTSWQSSLPIPMLAYGRGRRTFRAIAERLAKTTGWPLESICPREILWLDGYHDIWFNKGLVMCPECLANSYHSHWHQLRGLNRCPWHECELIDSCERCGQSLGPYAANSGFLAAPYRCPSCLASLQIAAGKDKGRAALWARRKEIDCAFAPCRRWARKVAIELRSLHSADLGYEDSKLAQWWSKPDALIAITSALTPPPPDSGPPSGNTTYLIWPLQYSAPLSTAQTSYTEARYIHRPAEPYEDVLQRLREWILDTCVLPDTSPFPEFLNLSATRLVEWPTAALAYMLLRRTWERLETWSPNAAIRHICLIQRSEVLWSWQNVEYHPVSVRALTLATFAAFYWMIERSRDQALSRYCGDDSITTAYLSEHSTPMFGAVWFPTIPGVVAEEASNPIYMSPEEAALLLKRAHQERRVRTRAELRR